MLRNGFPSSMHKAVKKASWSIEKLIRSFVDKGALHVPDGVSIPDEGWRISSITKET